MTIFLCGFMGCGKSTVGKKLADILQCDFTDMDEYIEQQAGKKIPAIFAEHGEPYFRDLETQAVRELSSRSGVIACGGGAMLRERNAQIAQEHGSVILLDVPFSVCYERIRNTDRPLVRNNTPQQLENLYYQRAVLYQKHATYKIDASHGMEQTIQAILQALQP